MVHVDTVRLDLCQTLGAEPVPLTARAPSAAVPPGNRGDSTPPTLNVDWNRR